MFYFSFILFINIRNKLDKESTDMILFFQLAKSTALLTHSHKHGYNGAILQAVAIHRVLFEDDEIHKLDFVRNLKETMKIMEESSEKVSSNVAKSSGKR